MDSTPSTAGRWSVADGDTIRSTNTSAVFDHIYTNRQTDRASIARDTGLSPTTVSAITGELLDAGVIRESGSGKSRGGRRPIVLEVVPSSRLAIGVEVGASHITAVLLDLFGRVLADAVLPILTDDRGQESVATIKRLIKDIIFESSAGQPVAGIGIGLRSKVARPGWSGIDVEHEIKSAFGLPVWIDNDANLGALAEAWWGKGQDVADFTYVKLGGGIGAGHIVGGEIYHGHSGAAGEIGHTPSAPGGLLCACGRRGCLEAYVSSRRLVELFQQANPDVASTGVHTTDRRILIDAANNGDATAKQIVVEAGERLGISLSTVIGLLAPAMIVLSGPITRVDGFVTAVSDQVDLLAFEQSIAQFELAVSELDKDAGAIGAATLVISNMFRVGVATLGNDVNHARVSG